MILDISDPANPDSIGSCVVGGCGYGVAVRDSIAYVHTYEELVIVDVRNPAAPQVMGRDSSYGRANDIVFVGDYVVLGVYGGVNQDLAELQVFDVADPANPACVLTVEAILGYPSGLWAEGDLIYAACTNGLAIYRLGLPRAPDQNAFEGGAVSGTPPERTSTPLEFRLEPNTPNPFNAVTTLHYALPQAGPVDVAVFDLTGRQVVTLTAGFAAAGSHELRWDAAGLPSGSYLIRLQSGSAVQTRKAVLLK